MSSQDKTTKDKIISTSLELIKKSGYDNVTLNDICKAAGVSKHTFYYYFKSKDEILLAFYTIPQGVTADRLVSIFSAENNFEQLWQLIEPSIDFFSDAGPEIAKRVFIANISRDIGTFNHSQLQSDLAKAQLSIITKAQESKEIRNSSEPRLLLWTIFAQVMGISTKWCISNGGFDLKEAVRASVETTLDVAPELRKYLDIKPPSYKCSK